MQRYSIASSSKRKSFYPSELSQSQTLELEHLEQEITLTLQEVDKNLSKCNQVINDKLFPIIKRYATSSRNVWSNVGFWKYFLEQSANVELTGYEEPTSNVLEKMNKLQNNDDVELRSEMSFEDDADVAMTESKGAGTMTESASRKPRNSQEPTETPSTQPDISQDKLQSSTPQRGNSKKQKTNNYGYDTSDSIVVPLPSERKDISMETDSTITQPQLSTKTLRQSMDNSLKIQISPIKRKRPSSAMNTPRRKSGTSNGRVRSSIAQQFDSSPVMPEPPVLESEINYSPLRLSPEPAIGSQDVQRTPRSRSSLRTSDRQRFPTTPKYQSSNVMRTPTGINLQYDSSNNESLLGADIFNTSLTKQPPVAESDNDKTPKQVLEDDSDSDATDLQLPREISPPVTISFATGSMLQTDRHQAELVQTPAREAAQNIVNEILQSVEGDSSNIDDLVNGDLFKRYAGSNSRENTSFSRVAMDIDENDIFRERTATQETGGITATSTSSSTASSHTTSSLNSLFQEALANHALDDRVNANHNQSVNINNLFDEFRRRESDK